MSPWWLRPTAEGANEPEPDERREAASRAASLEPAAPEVEPASPEPPPTRPEPSFARPEAFEPRPVTPFHQPTPAGEPHEETPREESPEPQAVAEPAPFSWGEPAHEAYAEPQHAEPSTEETAELAAEAASRAPEVSPAVEDPTAPTAPFADLEPAEREEGQGERKRSRSRRGRRRKPGGGAAASGNGAAAAAEDEDLEGEEEAMEAEPAPAPVAPIQHHRTREAARPADDSFYLPPDYEIVPREVFVPVERPRSPSDERKIALFCDLENIALGVRDSEVGKFDINRVLERLLEKGKIIVKKAYADWERYSDYKRPFHEAAIELIDIPQKYYSGKNSADIKMVVDAMDLSYAKEHLDTFVLLSGDSDFSPLVSKLKENNKYVIGIGVKNSSSNLLVDNCDEFIYYEDVWRDSAKGPQLLGLTKKAAEAFSLMVESIQALVRENKDVLWGSMIKQTMQRKKPSFNEGYYGYSTFSELLEDAERKNIIKLKKDQRSGTYIVTGFAKR